MGLAAASAMPAHRSWRFLNGFIIPLAVGGLCATPRLQTQQGFSPAEPVPASPCFALCRTATTLAPCLFTCDACFDTEHQ